MKKLLIPAVLIAALLISSCGKTKNPAPSPLPSTSPGATSSAATLSPSGQPAGASNIPGESDAPNQESSSDNEYSTVENNDSQSGQESSGQSDSVSIINGSSTAFYAVYLTTTAGGNPGENIIGDTPLGEGEEIVLPFANAPEESLTIIVEDENGIQYSAGGINLSNGLSIELHLDGGTLIATVH